MRVLVEKEIGCVSDSALVVALGVLVCDGCFVSEK